MGTRGERHFKIADAVGGILSTKLEASDREVRWLAEAGSNAVNCGVEIFELRALKTCPFSQRPETPVDYESAGLDGLYRVGLRICDGAVRIEEPGGEDSLLL